MAEEATGSGAAAPASALSQAADRIRESAKWLIVSFAAVGAALIAGLQIADIGGLTNAGPEDRLTWAIVGIALGVGGVVVAIGSASYVVTKSFITLKGLSEQDPADAARKSVEGDQALLGGYDSVEALNSAYAEAAKARVEAWRAYYEDPSGAGLADKAQAASNWAVTLDRVQSHVLERASFANLRSAYNKARWGILAGAAVCAAGIAAFAWAANPPKQTPPAPVLARTPTNATVIVNQANRKRLARLIGKRCDLTALNAIAVKDIGFNYRVVSLPTPQCKAVLFTVTPTVGRVVLAEQGQDSSSTQTSAPSTTGGK